MTILCDTSVLIAATSEDHAHHEESLRVLSAVHKGKMKGVVSAHSLAEFYSSMSAMPQPLLPSPVSILEILKGAVLHHFGIVALDPDDYWEALKRVVVKNVKSGVIFDALIFQAAIKAKTSHLVTWNTKDFEKLSDGELEIVTPEAFR